MWGMNILNTSVFLCFLTFFISNINSELDVDQLDADLAHVLACKTNPAIAVSVVQDGNVVFSRGYGQANPQKGIPATNKTVFGVGSLSKAFASTLLLKLLQRNNISLNTPVVDVLGSDFQFEDNMRTKYATIEDLLSHRLGIPANNYLRFDTNLTRANLPKRLRYLKATRQFRSSYIYSNILYGVVMHITEHLGGKTWEELVKEEIFVPLGMTSSSFLTTQDLTSRDVAQAIVIYRENEQVLVSREFSRRWAFLCACGGVMSTAEDMAKWMHFHLSGGLDLKGKRVMDAKLMATMHSARNAFVRSFKYFVRPRVPVTTSSGAYTLGWRRGYYRGYPIITHTGTTFGYQAMLTLIPSRKFGVFIASTGNDDYYFLRVTLTNYVTDVVLGETPWLNRTTLCSFPKPWIDKSVIGYTRYNNSLPYTRNISAYEGVFVNTAYGNLEVYFNTTLGRLIVKYGFGRWVLYAKEGSPDSMYGAGFGVNVEQGCRDFVFRSVNKNENLIDEIEARCFEFRLPPVFVRKESSVNSMSKFTTNLLVLVCLILLQTPAV